MPAARTTDPQTSHDAAASVKKLSETHRAILQELQTAQTDVDLVRAIQLRHGFALASESGIRSRRAELVRDGYVEDTGKRERLESGRMAIVWVKS